jgi:hypothetical protein
VMLPLKGITTVHVDGICRKPTGGGRRWSVGNLEGGPALRENIINRPGNLKAFDIVLRFGFKYFIFTL